MGRLSRHHQQARDAAIAAGSKTYHGRECSKCEATERYISSGTCVACAIQRVKHAYWSDPDFNEKCKARAAERQREDRQRTALDAARNRATRNGLPFDLTRNDISIPETCPVLGIPLDFRDRDHTPSIDRIVNEKGYVRGNVEVISMRANRIKSDATPEELAAVLAYSQRS